MPRLRFCETLLASALRRAGRGPGRPAPASSAPPPPPRRVSPVPAARLAAGRPEELQHYAAAQLPPRSSPLPSGRRPLPTAAAYPRARCAFGRRAARGAAALCRCARRRRGPTGLPHAAARRRHEVGPSQAKGGEGARTQHHLLSCFRVVGTTRRGQGAEAKRCRIASCSGQTARQCGACALSSRLALCRRRSPVQCGCGAVRRPAAAPGPFLPPADPTPAPLPAGRWPCCASRASARSWFTSSRRPWWRRWADGSMRFT